MIKQLLLIALTVLISLIAWDTKLYENQFEQQKQSTDDFNDFMTLKLMWEHEESSFTQTLWKENQNNGFYFTSGFNEITSSVKQRVLTRFNWTVKV